MTDDFEKSLRDALAGAVPTPPDEPGRADGARGYSRRVRRTRAVLAVGVAAAVVAAIVVIPSVLSSPDSDVAGPGKSLVTDPPPQGGPACPPAGRARKATPVAAVPGNAVGARLCVWAPAGSVWSPREPLVTGLGDLARTLNALPPATPHGCIPATFRPIYTLIFQYAGGQRVVVTGELSCGYVDIGRSSRDGAQGILQSYLGDIADQRQHYDPPASSAPAEACAHWFEATPTGQLLVDGRELSLRVAQVCVFSNYLGGTTTRAGLLTPGDIRMLNSDFASHRSRTRPNDPRVNGCFQVRGGGIPTYQISGTSIWGDPARLTGTCELFSYTDRSGHWYWVPSPAVLTMIESAMHPTGTLAGRLLATGGVQAASRPLVGRVTLQGPQTVDLLAGDDGRFEGSLQPGRYRVVGHSPLYGGSKYPCHPMHRFVWVPAGQTVHVTVFCQEK